MYIIVSSTKLLLATDLIYIMCYEVLNVLLSALYEYYLSVQNINYLLTYTVLYVGIYM